MLSVIQSNIFKRDFKRAIKRGYDPDKFAIVLRLLIEAKPLPARCRPHKLSGEYADLWECHIAPDWLLIYDFDDMYLRLYRTGTHADLFD
jgi:mRNA interferase YafQ